MRIYLSNILRISEYALKNESTTRFYSRWVHRRPKRVVEEHEFEAMHRQKAPELEPNVIELDRIEVQREVKSNRKLVKARNLYDVKSNDNQKYAFDIDEIDQKTHFERVENSEKTQLNKNKKGISTKNNLEVREKKEISYTNNEVLYTTFDDNGDYVYQKMKDNDSRIGTLMLMVKSRKLRGRKESVLLEGKRLIKDALEAGCVLEHLMFSRKNDLEFVKNLLPQDGVKLYKMAYKDMQMWSDLTTSPGIMGIFKTPNLEKAKISENSLPLTIICDNIREPGNLGAILRASVGVGCKNLILTKGCVDLWEPKVLRSASGAHFRLQITKDVPWFDVGEKLGENSAVFLADNKILTSVENNQNANQNLETLCANVPLVPYFGVNFKEFDNICLVIGGETLGLNENAYKLASNNNGVRLNIPLDNDVDSLNTGTALGIIIFEIKRQFLTNK